MADDKTKEKEQEQETEEQEDNNPIPTPKVVSDPSAKTVRKLQEQVSKLENLLQTEKAQREDLQNKFNLISKTPKGKSLLEDLDEFVFGKKEDSNGK